MPRNRNGYGRQMGMNLDVPLSLEPMEAAPVDDLPAASDLWQYEPKINGFRCLIFRDGDQVHLQSKSQRPLERFSGDDCRGESAAAQALRARRRASDPGGAVRSPSGPTASSYVADREAIPRNAGAICRVRSPRREHGQGPVGSTVQRARRSIGKDVCDDRQRSAVLAL
jgi:hypothetical protein